MSNSVVIIVDDADTSQITYSDGWEPGSPQDTYYLNTSHSVNTAVANATFYFRGTFVQAFGFVAGPNKQATGMYSIDHAQPTNFAIQADHHHQVKQLFDSLTLSDDQHVLDLFVEEGGSFGLDYITYNFTMPARGSPLSTSSSSDRSGSVAMMTSTPNTDLRRLSGTTAALIGSLVGCAVLIVAATLLLYALYRRRLIRVGDDDEDFGSEKTKLDPGSEAGIPPPTPMAPSAAPQELPPSSGRRNQRRYLHPEPTVTPRRRPVIMDYTPQPVRRQPSTAGNSSVSTHRRIARWVQSIKHSGPPTVINQ